MSKVKNIIKYRDPKDPASRYVDLPKIITEDYGFQMMFGFKYPSTSYNEGSGIKSKPFHGKFQDDYFKGGS